MGVTEKNVKSPLKNIFSRTSTTNGTARLILIEDMTLFWDTCTDNFVTLCSVYKSRSQKHGKIYKHHNRQIQNWITFIWGELSIYICMIYILQTLIWFIIHLTIWYIHLWLVWKKHIALFIEIIKIHKFCFFKIHLSKKIIEIELYKLI